MLRTIKTVIFIAVAYAMAHVPLAAWADPAQEPRVKTAASSAPISSDRQADLLEQSRKVKSNLDLWPTRVKGKLQEVSRQLETFDVREITSQRIALDDFAELLDMIDEGAAAIEESWADVKGEFALWRDAVTKAPDSFRALSSMYEATAAGEDDETLKLHYADLASASRKLAEYYEKQSRELDGQQQEIQRKVAYVGRSRTYIKRVKEFLATVPATAEGADVQAFCQRLNEYIKAFHESVGLFKGLADKLSQGQKPSKPAPQPPAEASALPVEPLSPAEYQARLTTLRRPR